MKIAFITEHFYPYTGGIAEHTFYLANELAQRHKVYVIAPLYPFSKFIPLPSPPRFEIVRIGKASFFPANGSLVAFTYTPHSIFTLRKVFRTHSFDVIHIQGAPVPTLPLFSAIMEWKNSFSPIKVVTFHAQHGKSLGYTVFKPLIKHALSKIDGSIAVSLSARLTIERHFQMGNMVIIPNGVDTRRFSPHGKMIERFLDGYFNVLFVGRMEPRKGFKTLLDALRGLNRKIRLIAVGSGPLINRYRGLSRRYGINAVFAGKIPPKKLAEYYRTADLLVAPSTKGESFGIVLLEAMASGLPIIASSVDGYVETLKEGRYGFIFPKRDTKELRKLIVYAIDNWETLKEISKRALHYVNENFSWSKIALRTEEYYKFLISARKNNIEEKLNVSV